MKQILAIVGMPGAGKTEAASFLKNRGFTVLRFGSVIDDGLKEENLPWTPENNAYYRKKVRDELGMAGVAIKMTEKIEKVLLETDKIILDGLYSWEEYKYLIKKLPDLKLLCIYARPKIRHQRLSTREERQFNNKQAKERDIDEIEVTNKGGPIAVADYLIKNETAIEDLQKELGKFLEEFNNDLL